jgi:hypothetical protein
MLNIVKAIEKQGENMLKTIMKRMMKIKSTEERTKKIDKRRAKNSVNVVCVL